MSSCDWFVSIRAFLLQLLIIFRYTNVRRADCSMDDNETNIIDNLRKVSYNDRDSVQRHVSVYKIKMQRFRTLATAFDVRTLSRARGVIVICDTTAWGHRLFKRDIKAILYWWRKNNISKCFFFFFLSLIFFSIKLVS